MEKRLFDIIENTEVAKDTFRLSLRSRESGFIFSGEFVDISIEGFYLRRPLSVCDYAPDSLTILYKKVGRGTEVLSRKAAGESLELLAGLGRGFDADECRGDALLISGGLGAAPLFPLAKKLKSQGKRVSVILCFNTASDIVLEREFGDLCDSVTVVTLDGSKGVKGFFSDALSLQTPEYDFYYTCGPLPLMRAVCRTLEGRGEASLEERMGCGAGFCYGCSCKTLVGTKRICKDGPVFKAEEIIW